MKVLVTGGAGFVGQHLVRSLGEVGHDVLVVDTFSSDWPSAERPPMPVLELDVRDEAALTRVLRGFDCIVHLASSTRIRGGHHDTRHDWDQSLEATRAALESSRLANVERFCFASSGSVYGNSLVQPVTEVSPVRPASLYAASKAASEAFVCAYSSLFGLKCTIFRLGNVLGPGLQRGVVIDFVTALRADSRRLQVLGDGRQQKSYVDVEDAISAMIHLGLGLGKREALRIFNVAGEGVVSVLDIANMVIERMGLVGVRITPTGGLGGWAGDVPVLNLSSVAARTAGWQPRYSAREAVDRMITNLVAC